MFTSSAALQQPPVQPVLDAERLDVFRVAVDFQGIAAGFAQACDAVLRDQLLRASVSICLNLAEGAGRRSRREKRRFYSIARGSAMECGAILHLLKAKVDAEAWAEARGLVIRIVQMLSRLEARMA